MAGTEHHEEHVSAPEVDYADLLRALTVERFTPWKPPESAPDRPAPLGHQRTRATSVNTSGIPTVRGRVQDVKSSNKTGRTR